MKKFYKYSFLGALMLLFNFANSQTTLVAGDIAVVGYVGNGTVAGNDQFSFVLLRDITATTAIKFTDNAWLRTSPTAGSWRTGEGIITWTSQSALATGTEVTIVFGTTITTTSRFQGTNVTAGTVAGTALSFSANGDQVVAYQGSDSSPTFITALHKNVYTSSIGGEPTTNAAIWEGSYSTANSCGLPTGLTTGVNAMWIGTEGQLNTERDNMRLTCGTLDLSTVAKIKAIVYNQANYTLSDDAPGFTIPTDCRFMDPALSDEEFDLNTKVLVYPNPFKNEINIKTNQNFDTIEVYSVLGNKILSEKFKNSINSTILSKGIYFVALINEKGSKVSQKIIKD
jgi:Secretion system C-terminal sorting domain